MAVALDASSPAVTSQISAPDLTTASFNPPDRSVLVATAMSFALPTGISNNGTGLTWTLAVSSGGIAIYTAPLPTGRTGMTVTATWSGSSSRALKVDVLTGGDLDTPVGATGNGTSSTNNASVTGYSSTIDGARGICGAVDSNNLGSPSSTDSAAAWTTGILSGMRVIKAANTSGSGTSVSFNLDAAGSSTPNWGWVAAEIRPAPPEPRRAIHVANVTAVHRAANW